MAKTDESNIDYYRAGHPSHPDGRVIVTEGGETTEYTLEAWQELQSSQPEE